MKKSERTILRTYVDEKTGANMQVFQAVATTKDKTTGKRVVVATFEYHEPVTLADGKKFDGEKEVTKVWKSERFTNALDIERNATKESRSAMMKQLLTVMMAGDKDKTIELSAKLGIDLKAGLAKMLAQISKEVAATDKDETEDETDDNEDVTE